jgi:hypothetical protein
VLTTGEFRVEEMVGPPKRLSGLTFDDGDSRRTGLEEGRTRDIPAVGSDCQAGGGADRRTAGDLDCLLERRRLVVYTARDEVDGDTWHRTVIGVVEHVHVAAHPGVVDADLAEDAQLGERVHATTVVRDVGPGQGLGRQVHEPVPGLQGARGVAVGGQVDAGRALAVTARFSQGHDLGAAAQQSCLPGLDTRAAGQAGQFDGQAGRPSGHDVEDSVRGVARIVRFDALGLEESPVAVEALPHLAAEALSDLRPSLPGVPGDGLETVDDHHPTAPNRASRGAGIASVGCWSRSVMVIPLGKAG